MGLRIDTQSKALDFLAVKQEFLKNHQNWRINYQLDTEDGAPLFHLEDSFGISYKTKEFIIEDVSTEFQQTLIEADALQQQELIQEYLQKQLKNASPHRIHIEKFKDKLFVRFGDYGLKGGNDDESWISPRTQSFFYSIGQIVLGITITFKSSDEKVKTFSGSLIKLLSGSIISSGLGSGLYSLTHKENFNSIEYLKEANQAFIKSSLAGIGKEGLLSLIGEERFLSLSNFSDAGKRVVGSIGHILGSILGNGLNTIANALIEHRTLPSTKQITDSLHIKREIASTIAGEAIDAVINYEDENLPEVNFLLKIIEKSYQGGLCVAASTVAANIADGEKYDKDLLAKALFGALANGAIAAVGAINDILQASKLESMIPELVQAKKWLDGLFSGKIPTKEELIRLRTLLKSSWYFFFKDENKLNLVLECLDELINNKFSDSFNIKLSAAFSGNQELFNSFQSGIDSFIDYQLNKGYRATIHRKHVKTREGIKGAYANGRKVRWVRGRTTLPELPEIDHFALQLAKYKDFDSIPQELFEQLINVIGSKYSPEEMAKLAESKAAFQQALLKAFGIIQDLKATHGQDPKLAALLEAFQKAERGEPYNLAKCYPMSGNPAYTPIKHTYTPFKTGNNLADAIKTTKVEFVDVDLKELIPHIVLVHAITGNNAKNYPNFNFDKAVNQNYVDQCAFKAAVSSEGNLGYHLDLEKREFHGKFEKRPQIHWAWNQLVQPNEGNGEKPANSWEDGLFGILEPLSAFESSIHQKSFGVAPYDTMTFGSHQLSDKSTILAPPDLVDDLRSYLTGFKGRIVPYKGDLRTAVFNGLNKYYPETWHISDEKGSLIGQDIHYFQSRQYNYKGGYRKKTCIRKTNGEIVLLIENSSTLKSKAFQEFFNSGRFIGLHNGSVTCALENRGTYFHILRKIKKGNHSYLLNNQNFNFAGIITDVKGLNKFGTLNAALNSYNSMLKYNPETGSNDLANYVINEAIYADLISMFRPTNPNEKFNLSPLDAAIIIKSTRDSLIQLLTDLQDCLTSSNDEEKAMDIFNEYKAILETALENHQIAKGKTLELLQRKVTKKRNNASKGKGKGKEKVPICFSIRLEDCGKVEIPSENDEIDFGKLYSDSEALVNYVKQVLTILPKEVKELKRLHEQIASYHWDNKIESHSEFFRLKMICSIIEYSIMEKIFNRRNDKYNIRNSSISSKLSNYSGWLQKYGLEAKDYTQEIGNCLFDNISFQLNPNKDPHLLRDEMVTFMKANPKMFLELSYSGKRLIGDGGSSSKFNNWEGYLQTISKNTVWGEEPEISALADMLGRPIILLTEGGKPNIYNRKGKRPPLFLNYVHGNHFEACVPRGWLSRQEIFKHIKNEVGN